MDSKSVFVGYPPWPYLSTYTPQNRVSSLISLLSVVGRDTPKDTPAGSVLSTYALASLHAVAARNGLYHLHLFAVVTDDQMTDEDGAIGAGYYMVLSRILQTNFLEFLFHALR